MAPCPEDEAGFLSKLTWHWMAPLLRHGARTPLSHNDLPALPAFSLVRHHLPALPSAPPSTFSALHSAYSRRYLLITVAALQPLWLAFALAQVLAVRRIVRLVDGTHTGSLTLGIALAAAMGATALGQALCLHHVFRYAMRVGMHVRAVISARVYQKAMRMRLGYAAAEREDGQEDARGNNSEATNVLTNDTQRVLDAYTYVPFLISNPIIMLVVSAVLVWNLGVAALLGVVVLMMLIPVQLLVGAGTAKLRARIIRETDSRVAMMSEVVRGVRVIKYGAWEAEMARRIQQIRKREVRWLMLAGVLEAVNNSIFVVVNSSVALATFTAFTLWFGRTLTADVGFSAIALYNIIARSVVMLPRAVKAYSECLVAFQRIDAYLALPEVPPGQPEAPEGDKEHAVVLEDANFAWRPGLDLALRDISLTVKPGTHTFVVGKVGAGKSSLLLSILGELHHVSGKRTLCGTTALATQVPWIVSGTVKENITMGERDYAGTAEQEEWYQQVVAACCLEEDFRQLPSSDATEIGERGVNLSGGQRARIALARACFARAQVTLLDDVLSAVDVRVALELRRKVLGPQGILHDRTVVLVTHNADVLEGVESVVALDGGRIVFSGAWAAFQRSSAYGVLAQHSDDGVDSDADDSLDENDKSLLEKLHAAVGDEQQAQPEATHPVDPTLGTLVEREDRRVGRIGRSIYAQYIHAAGGWSVAIAVVLVFATGQAFRNVAEFWVAEWSTDGRNRISDDTFVSGNRFYALVFVGLTIGTLTFSMLRAIFFVTACRHAARVLHDRLLETVLSAKQEFFDTNPVGRILNRFGKDMDQMDDLLPITAVDFFQVLFVAIGSLVTLAAVIPWLLILFIPVFSLYYMVQQVYVKSSREIKRLDGISRSPLYAQFSETLTGLATVRAFALSSAFSDRFLDRIDANHEAYYAFINSSRWLGIRLDSLAAVVVFSTSILAVVLRSSLTSGLAGLVITQSMLVTSIFQWGVRQAAETENLFTSVERVITVVKETSLEVDKPVARRDGLPEDWPSRGAVEFRAVSLRYRKDLPLVLKNLSFSLRAGEKVGVIGRTGAGKSSLAVALFRMVEIEDGSITIDGIDIQTIPLRRLRRAIAIVPQDPVLFTGTLRQNIDPTGLASDTELWGALNAIRFKELKALDEGLDTLVSDSGSNFSVGERQLLCLARALVSEAQVVVLDEATAAVDNRTDTLMQRAIRESFASCTVITVAHRLHTILHCDRVLVMDQGRLSSVIGVGSA